VRALDCEGNKGDMDDIPVLMGERKRHRHLFFSLLLLLVLELEFVFVFVLFFALFYPILSYPNS
jgi:hypothetical protein